MLSTPCFDSAHFWTIVVASAIALLMDAGFALATRSGRIFRMDTGRVLFALVAGNGAVVLLWAYYAFIQARCS